MPRILIYGCLIAATGGWFDGVLRASTIQLAPGAELTVDFALPGFGSSSAAYPATIGLELAALMPGGSATAPIPGSSQSYYSGILLQASLQSLDGSISLPLFDADSWRLGLATGQLVADATGGNSAVVSAEVAVSLNELEAIFGATGQAEFVVQNLGAAFTIGLGPGYSLSNAILAPVTFNAGSVSSAGYVESWQMDSGVTTDGLAPSVPEPAAFGLAAAGGGVLFWLRRRLKR